MISFEDVKTIFFDYDGTLHNSIKIYAPAFRKACDYLEREGLLEQKQWKNEEISYWLGFNPKEMWEKFMPHIDSTIKNKCSTIIGEEMRRLTESGKPELYEGALETLEYLRSKGYRLVFISNCKIAYRDCHCKLFYLDNYFEELVCSEEYVFIPKHEILRRIKDRYPKEMIIVGDRVQDIEAGKKNDIYTIGCTYGFGLDGEVEEADLLINDIKELKIYL